MHKLLVLVVLPLAVCAQRRPASYSSGIDAPAAWDLGPISAGEATRLPRPGVWQIGVQRAVPPDWSSHASASTVAGRRVWRAALRSPGAMELRLHFRNFSIDTGQVWVYDVHHIALAGPYMGRGPFASGEFWSAPIAAEEAIVEFDAAAGTVPGDPPFAIDAIAHRWTPDTTPTGPAACELDVTCYPQWSPYASGVVLYNFAGDSGGYYQCSGALLNPGNAAFAPFMLTANHCISSASEARSANLIFGDETAVCNGTDADVHLLGAEAGATYLTSASFEYGDYSLLTLTAPAPAGVYLFGWNTTAPAIGDPVVGIHHPAGSWARISFGQRDADAPINIGGVEVAPGIDYQVSYTQGIIEPGSSGSPLLNANAEVIGIASGSAEQSGASACQLGNQRASYGKLAVAYPALQPYLTGTVNPAPAFSVTPAALTVNQANGQVANAASLQVTTTSLLPVPLAVQAADAWLQVTAQNEFDRMPAFINSDTPLTLAISSNTANLLLRGAYQTSVTVTVGANAPVTIPVTLTVANTQSRVLGAVNGNPFPAAAETAVSQVLGTSAAQWQFNISLTESAGVATSVTSLLAGGQDLSSQIPAIFGGSAIPAAGSLSGVVNVANVVYNDSNFVDVAGVDLASGAAWTLHLLAQFSGPDPAFTSLLASGIPAVLYPNAAAPDCPLRQHIVLESTGDTDITLRALTRNDGSDASALLAYLASTYVPAGASVQGDMCWPNTPDPLLFEITNWNGVVFELYGTDTTGAAIYNEPGAAFMAPPPAVAPLNVTPSALEFTAAQPPPATLSVDPGAATPAWSTTVVYDRTPAAWLSLTPTAGIGPATIQISVNPAGLVPGGIYRATCIVQSLVSQPQYLVIPIAFTVPAATGMAYLNSASFAAGVSPGMILSLFDPGVTLANGIQSAGGLPLPPTMQGTTVTVNQVPAPLYYVSPTQLNIQVPYEAGPGPATVAVSNAAGAIASQSIYINAVAPGIFLAGDRRHIAPSAAATPGGYVTLYLTGQGPVSPAVATGAAPPNPDQVPVSGLPVPYGKVQVLVNGVEAQILFAGIPYYLVGVTQINFIVPPGTPAGDQSVVVNIGGVSSNTGYITVGPGS